MSEETMKILRMLEEGKITAAEASELLNKVEALEEKESQPRSERGPGPVPGIPDVGKIEIPPIPPVPPMPDVGRIVNDAIRDAFASVSFDDEGTPVEGPLTYQGTSFSGARLGHTDLSDARMDSNTRLEGADLRYASFADADLRGANLQGANLSYSDFADADFRGANLQGAQLHHGQYADSDFRDADLRGADLSLSNLADASFKGVEQPGLVLRGMNMPGVKYEQGASGPPTSAPDAALDTNVAEGEVDIEMASDDLVDVEATEAYDSGLI